MSALDLPLSDDFQMLQDSVIRYLRDNETPRWDGLAQELGLMSVGIAEAAGGAGGGAVARGTVAAELGPMLAGADWLAHVVATALIAQVAPGHPLLPTLIEGQQRIAVSARRIAGDALEVTDDAGALRVTGHLHIIAGAGDADYLLIADTAALVLLPMTAPGVTRHTQVMRDATPAADVALDLALPDDARLLQGAAAAAAMQYAIDMLQSGRCAEACGLMQRMFENTADYLNQRSQFGTPIARFQVLRHRMADMQMALMKAAALTEQALIALDEDPTSAGLAVRAACVEVIDAARIVGEGAVQLHGAMGLTEELKLGGQYKRALAIAADLGPIAAQLAQHAAARAA